MATSGTSKHLVIGLGEVGTAIQKVFNADGYDYTMKEHTITGQYDVVHICIPYSDSFEHFVTKYKEILNPKHIVIHSTVPVGTSRKCGALHSPIRGLHPNLYEGIMTFPKFIGGEQASEVADIFRRAGLKVILVDKQETTELGKLLDTEYYRACIEFTLKARELCDKHEVPFHESYTLFNLTYNEGYKELGHPEYVRPTLQAIKQPIGGHCVIPNSKLV
jgi:UDP-glucose 6-dehydrogenase